MRSTQVARPSSPPTAHIGLDVWTMIFVDTKPKKNRRKGNAVPIAAPVLAADLGILTWSGRDRALLFSKTDRIQIYIGDTPVTSISKPLLRATSETADDMIKNGSIRLPADTDKNGLYQLVNWLEAIVRGPVKPLNRNMSMTTSFNVCTVGTLLGMRKYVDSLYKKCERILRQDPPSYDDVDAITACKDKHERLFKIVVISLAVNVDNDEVPHPEEFTEDLTKNQVLDAAIKEKNRKYHARRHHEDQKAERELQKAAKAEEKKRQDAHKKKMANQDKAKWTSQAAKDSAMFKSCQAKLPASGRGKQFTPEERVFWMKRNGRKLPKGC